MINIILVGAGGIGGNLAPMIARYMCTNDKINLTIVDGDVIEKSNLKRQPYLNGDLEQNKARALAMKLNAAFGLNVSYYPNYIEDVEGLERLVPKDFDKNRLSTFSVVIGAVDNAHARNVMEQLFALYDNLVYIDAANEDYFGDVFLGLKIAKQVLFKSRGMLRPLHISSGTQRVKHNSCEVKSLANPQYYQANMMAATLTFSILSDFIREKKVKQPFISFDLDQYSFIRSYIGVEENCEENYQKLIVEKVNDRAHLLT